MSRAGIRLFTGHIAKSITPRQQHLHRFAPLNSTIVVRDECETEEPSSRQSRSHERTRVYIITFFIVLLVSLLANIIFLRKYFSPAWWDAACARSSAEHLSPVLESQAMRYYSVKFNGFMTKTVYRQSAGPEVDAAWEALGADYDPIMLPEHDAVKYGIAPGQVKRSLEQGGGFPVHVEALHHLHCLNLLRQTSYYNYDYYRKLGKGAFVNSADIVQLHATHCLDVLRQQLMCTADQSVFGSYWVKDIGPFVDFTTTHKCKDFESIRTWAEKHQNLNIKNETMVFRTGDGLLDEIP